MSLPVILRGQAEADIHEIYAYLERVRTGLGEQFIARLRDVLKRIESFPYLYAIVFEDVRAARLKRFQYVAYYYTAFSDRVEVLAVIHGSRAEETWHSHPH